MTANKWIWIDATAKRDEAAQDICRAPVIGLDTEYDSFRYFRERLCLLQVNSGEKSYVFDPLGTIDFSFLGDVFYSPNQVKAIHAGDNDIRILKRDYNFSFRNVFDTHRAASLLGRKELSLAALIRHYFQADFEKQKKLQRSRWENRPLTEEQLRYAVQDTFFLIDIYVRLREELARAGLLETASIMFEEIAAVTWHEKAMNYQGHRHIHGYDNLSPPEQERLKRLYRWRFHKAKNSNRAIFMVCTDQELLKLARTASPSSLDGLVTGAGISRNKAQRYGIEFMDILAGK